jgi:urease gamma subunit
MGTRPSAMELTPREKDKLLLSTAALLAERRKARGLTLNYPEAMTLTRADAMDGIAAMIPDKHPLISWSRHAQSTT